MPHAPAEPRPDAPSSASGLPARASRTAGEAGASVGVGAITPSSMRGAARALRRALQLYDEDDRDAPRFRARQLHAVRRLTPFAAAFYVLSALLTVWALLPRTEAPFVGIWAVFVCVMTLWVLHGWVRLNYREVRTTASPRTMRRWVARAGVAAALWAVLPAVEFPRLDPEGQFLLGMLTTGMIGAGGFVLSGVPLAATLYVVVVGIGGIVAMLRWDAPAGIGAAAMLASYCAIVIGAVWAYARTLAARLVAEARAERQGEVIALLMRDFEDHASDLLWETDARGRFVHVSPRLSAALGVPAEGLGRVRASALLGRCARATEEAGAHWREIRAIVAARTAFRDRTICVSRGPGDARWWSLSARPLLDERGRPRGWRGVATDVTDRHLAHRRLSWLAHNDPLTGLMNRTQFRERLQSWLQPVQGECSALAVMVLDLDGFKQVNDSRGHAAGDLLLQAVGDRLRSVVRRQDSVARLGGDEFALIVPGVHSRGDLAPMLDRVFAALSAPLRVQEHAVSLRASIGVAIAPGDGTDVDLLLQRADAAMYTAKQAGGQRACFYDAALAAAGRRRSELARDLAGAVARGEFTLVYQPQVDARDFTVMGFEALLRWSHPTHGEVWPSEFVPIAESSGAMPAIGDWVLTQACRQARTWPRSVRVSINVSPTQLAAPGFVDRVVEATRGLDAGRVELEITESVLVDDTAAAVATLTALRERGLRTALDDFGTGYSALGYLRRFPFDSLKIDRSFVNDFVHDDGAQVLVDTILAMARALGMSAVAEGVESPRQAAMLRERGCALLQGYLVSRPLAADAVAPFLASWRPSRDGLALRAA